ncbi:hypothetical protein Tco_1541097 [Tanacetum coccineum]
MITKKDRASSREISPGTTIKEGRIETDSFRTRDLTTDCSPTSPKAQERSWQPRRHDTNQCRELKHQIEEVVKSGRLPHLVKEVRKGKEKVSNTQLGEWKKGDRAGKDSGGGGVSLSMGDLGLQGKRKCRELKHQIEEAVKSGRLPHPVKEVRKGKAKVSNTQLGEWKKGDRGTTPTKALVIMISRRNSTPKRKSIEESTRGMGKITFPLFQETETPLIELS